MTAAGLLALWHLNDVIHPFRENERDVVAWIRVGQVVRYPDARDQLLRLLDRAPAHPRSGGLGRQRGSGSKWLN